MVDMKPVKSSNIQSVGYDDKKHELHVSFLNGNSHIYNDVSPDEHTALMGADSVGKHFHANIKKFKGSRKAKKTG